jgi:hypothetical protein
MSQQDKLIQDLQRQVRTLDREIEEKREVRRWLKGHLRHEILKQRRTADK